MIKVEHIVITAGGTVEAIDGVRQISNTSTGNLAACIYEALADRVASRQSGHGGRTGFMVHYVISESAVKPEVKACLPIKFYSVTDVRSVETILEKLLTGFEICYVIHSMAVSDFTKDYLVRREALAGEITEAVISALENKKASTQELKILVEEIMKSPSCALDTSVKADSQSDLILALKKTPKLIEKIKEWRPEAFLVGFKLLKGVSEQELIMTAAELAEKNGCDLVLANDMNKITKDTHVGLLLKGHEVIGRYSTKSEIAEGIARHMLGGLIWGK